VIPELDIYGKTIPCDEIGGDYYDFIMEPTRSNNQLSVVVGMGVSMEYQYLSVHKSHLKKGQMIIIATDGIWKVHNKIGEMFGKQRIQSLIRTYASLDAETIIETIFNEHRQFIQDTKREDDLTMVIIKIK
jgi:serine phosphatase RsbU (regulator of sigma subunit)